MKATMISETVDGVEQLAAPIEVDLRWVCGYGFGEPGNRTISCPPERDCTDACGFKIRPPKEKTDG